MKFFKWIINERNDVWFICANDEVESCGKINCILASEYDLYYDTVEYIWNADNQEGYILPRFSE